SVRIDLAPVSDVLRVKDYSGKPLLVEAQKEPVIISLMGDQVRGNDIRFVEFGPAIIVAHYRQKLRQGNAGNKNDSNPVMHRSIRHIYADSGALCFPPFDQHFALS